MFWIRWPFKKKKDKELFSYNDYLDDYYKNFIYPTKKSYFSRKKLRNTLTRVVIVISILTLLLVVREIDMPRGEQLRSNIRYLLTTEWNFQPMWEDAVRLAGQITNWDNPSFNNWPGTAEETVPASGNSERIWMPVSGKVVRGFGWTENTIDGLSRFHPGVDIAVEPGTPVRAVMDGTVIKKGEDGRLGEYILLNHGNEIYTFYAGIQNVTPVEGSQVSRGDKIAEVSEEGDVSQGGLHFELRENGELVDPLKRLHRGD